jgi:hypothetical protein
MTWQERFWSKVGRRGPDECWPWLGVVGNNGYGKFDLWPHSAHRIMWKLSKGYIPKGRFVCHSCDNPLCVNPRHLWLGTNKTNMADMKKKGRSSMGERNARAKLTWRKVAQIRRAYDSGESSFRGLAARFEISDSQIGRIVHRQEWRQTP